jgi:integrase
MTSIKRRPTGQWRARYRDAAGKEHARHFERKVDAQSWLDQVTASVVRGDYVDPKAGRVTLAAYAAAWEAVQVSSDGTRRIVDNALRLHILPGLGNASIASIRTSQVQGFVRALEGKGLSPGTVLIVYGVLARVFAAAVDDKVIAATPCRRIRLPKDDSDEVVIPSVEEVMALRDAFDPRWGAAVVVLAGSGLRIGELLGLHIEHVDFLRRAITVEQQRTQSGAIGPLKSKTSRRVVPVGQVVIEALAAHLAAYPTHGPLFVDELGKPLRYRRWRSLAEAAAREAGVHVTAHTMRHFFASALIRGGATVKQVQTVLGHASPVITLEIYSHLWPGDDDRTRDLADAALAPLADSLRTAEAVNG